MIAPDRARRTFSKLDRLRNNGDFRLVFDNGVRMRGKKVLMYAIENGSERSRLGLAVGKKAGNSVRRNRIRRVLREAFRLNRQHLSAGFDVVFVAGQGWGDSSLSDVAPEIARLFEKLSSRAQT